MADDSVQHDMCGSFGTGISMVVSYRCQEQRLSEYNDTYNAVFKYRLHLPQYISKSHRGDISLQDTLYWRLFYAYAVLFHILRSGTNRA